MGYQLPEDVDAVSGLRWYLVAVPDDDAYGIAALGAYTDLANVWKWGKEGISEDSYTARQQWLSAIDETLEALEMGFPTTLLGYIDEVETLLRAIRDAQQIAQPCCDSTLYNPAPAAIDEAVDSVPQVIQDNYTTGDDWGEVWEAYMCPLLREAWTRIDDHVLEPWEYYINLGGGGVALLTTLYVAWAGIGAAVVVAGFTIADVLALFAAVKGYIGEAVMGDYSDWDTHADDFICAVRYADGPEAKQAAAEDFIDSLSYSAPVKLLARFAFHSGFWKQVYSGIGADGNEIIVSGDGCPTCDNSYLNVDFGSAADGWGDFTQAGSPTLEVDAVTYDQTDYVVSPTFYPANGTIRVTITTQQIYGGSCDTQLLLSGFGQIQQTYRHETETTTTTQWTHDFTITDGSAGGTLRIWNTCDTGRSRCFSVHVAPV